MKSLQAGGTVHAKASRQERGTVGSKICEEVNVVGRGRKQDSSESCRHTGTGEAAHRGCQGKWRDLAVTTIKTKHWRALRRDTVLSHAFLTGSFCLMSRK